MSTSVIDPFSGINSIGGLSTNVIDIWTNINSVVAGTTVVTPGSGLYESLPGTLNVGVDNNTIEINGSNLLQLKNDYITFSSTDGIDLTPSGNVSLGGNIVLNVDNTVIRTNKIFQEISGNIKLGDGTSDALIVEGGIGVNGNINASGQITATKLCSSSDKRLKKNIEPLENCLKKVNEIGVFSYHWRKRKGQKRDNVLNYGVIAQQLEDIDLNHMVMTNTDNFKSVSYTQLIPMLIGSVKELTKKVSEMQEEINLLKK